MKNYWETVGDYMNRFEVPGGWLYKEQEAMVFVPKPAEQVKNLSDYQNGWDAGYSIGKAEGDKVKQPDGYQTGYEAGFTAAAAVYAGDKVKPFDLISLLNDIDAILLEKGYQHESAIVQRLRAAQWKLEREGRLQR